MADDTVIFTRPKTPVEEMQAEWHELKFKVEQLESQRAVLEHDLKTLRALLERVIEHRQKSHGELVLLLTGLVSKLPINDVGILVTRLVEHNTHVSEILSALVKGKADADLPQPALLKALDQTKQDLAVAATQAVEELLKLDTPLEDQMLRSLVAQPKLFFSPKVVRASRCFVKGQVPRERILREFGDGALVAFNDVTTDAKLNPRPKPDEIVLAFKPDAEAILAQPLSALSAEQQPALLTLYRKVQRARENTETARAQKDAFARLSFALDLLHYYENQSTEPADVVFAQRLPALIEQLVLSGAGQRLEEQSIAQAEVMLALVLNPEHRLMIVNNVGKGGGLARTLKYVLRLRGPTPSDADQIVSEFLRHLLPAPPQAPPSPRSLSAILRLITPEAQRLVVRALRSCDRIPKERAQEFARELAAELGVTGLEEPTRSAAAVPPETERQMAWEKIKDLITRRTDPIAVAAAIRDRLHARYDAEELRQSWITLTEADPIALIRIFCQLPYRGDGKTDPIAQTVLQSYVSRLTHEKYAAIYQKVVTSLRNLFKVKSDSPTLLNFVALVKWADPEAAAKLGSDIGLVAHAH